MTTIRGVIALGLLAMLAAGSCLMGEDSRPSAPLAPLSVE